MTDNQDNTPEELDGEGDQSWDRREWIKLVGITAAGLSVLGGNELFGQGQRPGSSVAPGGGGDDFRYENGQLYVSRKEYASTFGATTGDKIRLGDTELFIEVEKDYHVYGEENKFGGGKTVRDGMGQSASVKDAESLDMCILGAIVIDHWGIVKADIGIKNGKIVGVGNAGNPDTQEGVTPGLIIGPSTEIHGGWKYIVTAGGIDSHVHYICPDLIDTALYSGLTTLLGGGTGGPNDGTTATTVTGGPHFIRRMLESSEELPINIGLLGKGNTTNMEAQVEMVKAGACGTKIHEDWGATPSAINAALTVADKYDVQVALHSDSLNEGGYLEDTMRAIRGRTIHSYHTEGAGGGHAPDIMEVASYPNILPASTNPTKPYTVNTVAEHLDMLVVCHHLDRESKTDLAFAESRIRPSTIAAEDILQDMGAISMMSSDSQAMGRISEVIIRTWQTAHKMKLQRGALPEDKAGNDNFRVKRYIAKYTINPALTHGIASYVGSIEPGKVADLVVWRPEMFGVKPEMVYKAGMLVASRMGDPSASISTPQPVIYRRMYGALGSAVTQISFNFVSKHSLDSGTIKSYGLKKTCLPVKGCRTVGKKDMIHNSAMPKIDVNPETYAVTIDGKPAIVEPLKEVPLAQRYHLF